MAHMIIHGDSIAEVEALAAVLVAEGYAGTVSMVCPEGTFWADDIAAGAILEDLEMEDLGA